MTHNESRTKKVSRGGHIEIYACMIREIKLVIAIISNAKIKVFSGSSL
jgi:hypothetical protein